MEDEAILIERASKLVAEAIRPRLKEFEREQDRLLGAVREAKEHVQRITAEHSTVLHRMSEAHTAELVKATELLEAEERKVDLLKLEQQYQDQALPGYVDLPTDAGNPPTIVVDLHGSLSPDRGFPMQHDPWPGAKEALDEFAGRGCVIVVATAALSPDHPRLVRGARERMAWDFINKYALPIRYVTGKVGAHLFVDDRMVPVDATSKNPWEAVYKGIVGQLEKRAELGKDGIWRLIDLPTIGKAISRYPDFGDIPGDQPRGFSTPILDVDIHRCLLESNSSTQDSAARPGAKDVVNRFFDLGFTIHPSCAGWDPASHDYSEAMDRLYGLQRTIRREGIKYDEIVAKLHGTVFIDDKGFAYSGDWLKDEPLILARMKAPAPEDEVTGYDDESTEIDEGMIGELVPHA